MRSTSWAQCRQHDWAALMAREAFVDINFQARTLAVIEQANAIIAEYEAQGFTMTLRQLYYQFVPAT